MKAAAYFSDSYAQARARFVAAAQAAGAQICSYAHPEARGPDGAPLFMDTAWFGPADAETVLLNTSGTHGAEGFGGSAAQLAWISEGHARDLPQGVAVLMVHAVNPFGFAWVLRGTENNVDLNRNFVDHRMPYPENKLYGEIHPFLCPKTIDEASIARMLKGGALFVARHGQWVLEDAISRGQYSHADGYHFGGHAPEWSNLTLRHIVRRSLGGARRVGFIDWHTGPAGNGELIHLCFSDPKGPEFARAARWWGRQSLDPKMIEAMWGSRRPSRRGILFWGLESELAGRARVTGAVVEIRSAQPKTNAADALRVPMLERWLRFEGGLHAPEAARYTEEIREDYAPRRVRWQENAITHALDCYARTLDGMCQWGAEDLRAAD